MSRILVRMSPTATLSMVVENRYVLVKELSLVLGEIPYFHIVADFGVRL